MRIMDHTDEELKWIKDYMRRNPNITLPELYGKLRTDKGYSRHACSLFRVMRKLGYFVNKEHSKKDKIFAVIGVLTRFAISKYKQSSLYKG